MASAATHRVVIVGAGFGGLFAARFLGGAPVTVTVVDRTNHHLFQPLLYQVATGILSAGQIAPPTRDVLKRYSNVSVELAEVTGIDLAARRVAVTRSGGQAATLPYDSLVVGAGVGQSYFGHDEFAEFAPGMKTLDDALAQRERIFGAFEMAELEDDAEARQAWLTFVVVGGGPTGVEISGQIAELSRRALTGNFRRFDPAADVKVLLFEGGEEILATFGDRLSGKGTKALQKTGVEVHTGSIVTGVDADGVDVKGKDGTVTRYPAKTKIWAAGVSASPLAKILADASGAEVDRAGRIKVQADCSLPGHPEVFAIGDMMSLNDLPGVAEVAMQTGIHAARTIRRRLDGEEPQPFKYRDLGSMAAVSRRRAVVSFHGVRVSGFLGWLMWLFVHLAFMTGFKNRFKTLISWSLSFIGRGRTERALTRHVS
ncbi:MAG: NAD(P)/FAD-dependent oxidoreductase [Solirubrobacteraceae bacterium]